jgi:hypothetical protein
MIDLNDIQRVRSQFSKDEEGWFWSGEFVSLFGDLVIALARYKDKIVTKIHRKYLYMYQDLSNLGVILFKLEWIRLRAEIDDSLKAVWWQFATLDIEHFHIEYRSIFDYVAQIIREIANKPGQIPDSFRGLQEWLNKNPGNRARLGEELANLVDSVDWFPDIQDLRDSMIHRGAFTLVFLDPEEGILFQSLGNSLKPLIKNETVMDNENVVDFQLYCALYLCRLLLFLEELAKIIRSKLSIEKRSQQAKSYSPGFELLISWLDRLTEKIKA